MAADKPKSSSKVKPKKPSVEKPQVTEQVPEPKDKEIPGNVEGAGNTEGLGSPENEGTENANEHQGETQQDVLEGAEDKGNAGENDSNESPQEVFNNYEQWLSAVDAIAGEGWAASKGAGNPGNDQLVDMFEAGKTPQQAVDAVE